MSGVGVIPDSAESDFIWSVVWSRAFLGGFWPSSNCNQPVESMSCGSHRQLRLAVLRSEVQCWRGFSYCEPQTACYVFLPFGFEGHHKRVDFKLIEKWVGGELCLTACGCDVTIGENSRRESLLMGVVKQVKNTGGF